MDPIISANFITSSTDLSQCPKPDFPEYAFMGRSNVGKSSLINMLTGMKMLAKTSTAPGKTRLINHFLINEQWYLVDLPGYGYAKVGQQVRKKWEQLIESYLTFKYTPDVVIKSGGDHLTDFLIWQSVYSELFFSDVNWKYFRKVDFLRILRDYQSRIRRFGK